MSKNTKGQHGPEGLFWVYDYVHDAFVGLPPASVDIQHTHNPRMCLVWHGHHCYQVYSTLRTLQGSLDELRAC